jgi:vancomycin permeability regulator SanA
MKKKFSIKVKIIFSVIATILIVTYLCIIKDINSQINCPVNNLEQYKIGYVVEKMEIFPENTTDQYYLIIIQSKDELPSYKISKDDYNSIELGDTVVVEPYMLQDSAKIF